MKLNPTAEEEEGSATIEEVHIDLDEDTTLVDGESGSMKGVKKMDVEISDEESESEDAVNSGNDCGVKRKRTIRLIIRSRAFL